MERTRPSAPVIIHRRLNQSNRLEITQTVCTLFAAIIFLSSMLSVLASFHVGYGTIRTELVQLYGEDRTSRYFTPIVFHSFVSRVQFGSGVIAVLAIVIVGFRRQLSRHLESFWGALQLSARHERRSHAKWNLASGISLGSITVIGFFLRLYFVNQPMRYDESATVLGYASKPFYLGLSIYNEPNNHLFHTLLVHIAMKFAGSAEWAVRLPALLAGSLLCLLTYTLARRFSDTVAALWAAAFVSTSSILVEYSTNGRGYTMLCCAAVALLVAGLETLHRASPWWFFLFGLTAVLGFWTIPIFLIPFGGTALWIAFESVGRQGKFRRLFWMRLVITCVAAGAATVFVYLLPIAVNGPNALFRNQWVSPQGFPAFLTGNLGQLRLAGQLWMRDLPIGCSCLFVIGFALSLILHPRLCRLVICLAGWSAMLLVGRRFVPFARTWLVFLPIFLFASALGLCWIFHCFVVPRRRAIFGMTCTIIITITFSVLVVRGGSVLASTETGVFRSASQVAAFIASRNIPPDHVFRSSASDLPLQYYWWRRTGTRPAIPTRKELERKGVYEAWFLVNATNAEYLEPFSVQQKFENIRVLDQQPFDGACLYHVRWTGHPI